MRPYLLKRVLHECPRIYQQFLATKEIVDRMWFLHGNRKQTLVPTCHLVVRLVYAKVPGLTIVDGCVRNGFEHSWLRCEDRRYVIDTYPVAMIGGPILVDVSDVSPWFGLYDPTQKPYAVTRPSFESEVAEFLRWYDGVNASLTLS